jgi:hypothetical protein
MGQEHLGRGSLAPWHTTFSHDIQNQSQFVECLAAPTLETWPTVTST